MNHVNELHNAGFVQGTPEPEKLMAYVARVSNPNNQDNESFEGLLSYCIKHEHWSVFEQSSMTIEIYTTRAIAAQILRHRSFTFQEFSQRYANPEVLMNDNYIPIPELRRQDNKNRQNSIDDIPDDIQDELKKEIQEKFNGLLELYEKLLHNGVAKECARSVLPLAAPTRLYMTGSCRSWIHYINLRSAHGTQKEHMLIANSCKKIFCEQHPVVSRALGFVEDK